MERVIKRSINGGPYFEVKQVIPDETLRWNYAAFKGGIRVARENGLTKNEFKDLMMVVKPKGWFLSVTVMGTVVGEEEYGPSRISHYEWGNKGERDDD